MINMIVSDMLSNLIFLKFLLFVLHLFLETKTYMTKALKQMWGGKRYSVTNINNLFLTLFYDVQRLF